MKLKMHKRLPASELARKGTEDARESEPVNPQMYFFPIIFGGKPTKTGRDLES